MPSVFAPESRRVGSRQWCDNAYDVGQRSVCHICCHGRYAQCPAG